MAKLTFQPIADTATIWFLNASAWNNYLDSISVSISGADVGNASPTSLGCVRMASKGTNYIASAVSVETSSLTIDMPNGVATSIQYPSANNYSLLVNKFNELAAVVAELKTNLQNAGIIG